MVAAQLAQMFRMPGGGSGDGPSTTNGGGDLEDPPPESGRRTDDGGGARRLCWTMVPRRGRRSSCAGWSSGSARSSPSPGWTSSCRPGICFGLLGPNGAGKSTTMRMLTAQTLADEGTIARARVHAAGRVQAGADGDGRRSPAGQPRRRADLPPDPRTCSPGCTASAAPSDPAAVDRALEIANLQSRADTIVRELSGGMRRRLLVARGLIHRPAAGPARRADRRPRSRRCARSCGR